LAEKAALDAKVAIFDRVVNDLANEYKNVDKGKIKNIIDRTLNLNQDMNPTELLRAIRNELNRL
jgi:hypothetical protein